MLSLLRVESLSVESMMSRSFREADHQKQKDNIRKELKTAEEQLKEEYKKNLSEYLKPLIKFYESARTYLDYREEVLVIWIFL